MAASVAVSFFCVVQPRKLPPIAVSPWHVIDGRSYAAWQSSRVSTDMSVT